MKRPVGYLRKSRVTTERTVSLAKGVPEEEARVRAKDRSTQVTHHFFTSGRKPDGTGLLLRPPLEA